MYGYYQESNLNVISMERTRDGGKRKLMLHLFNSKAWKIILCINYNEFNLLINMNSDLKYVA